MLFDCLKKLYMLGCFGGFSAIYRFKVVMHSKNKTALHKNGVIVKLFFYNKESKNNISLKAIIKL